MDTTAIVCILLMVYTSKQLVRTLGEILMLQGSFTASSQLVMPTHLGVNSNEQNSLKFQGTVDVK